MQDTDAIAMPMKWPEKLGALEVNDSLPVNDDDIEACRVAVSRIHKATDREKLFTTRTIEGLGETRVWRIK